jgi:hypothetical protein
VTSRVISPRNRKIVHDVGFEVLTTVVTNTSVFWDIMQCSQLKSYDVSEEHVASIFRVRNCHLLSFWPLGLLFDPEDGNMFLQNCD